MSNANTIQITLTLDVNEIGLLNIAINQTVEDLRTKMIALQGKTDTASVETLQIYQRETDGLVALNNKIWNSPEK